MSDLICNQKIDELKSSKFWTIYQEILKSAIFPNGFKKLHKASTHYEVNNEKYVFDFSLNGTHLTIWASIRRKDCDSSKELTIYGYRKEIFTLLLSEFYSDKYAFGKWINETKSDWDFIEGDLIEKIV